jgi:hypothetical protein
MEHVVRPTSFWDECYTLVIKKHVIQRINMKLQLHAMSALVFLTSYQTCKFHGRSKYRRLHGTTQYNQAPIKICNHLVIHVQAKIPMPKHFFFRQFDAVCHPLL